ncbi:CAP domain-containing protein [Ruoffia sp. FAM 26255]|uniref:CAP domain-containing protein n=1 Tax=Ruoffia sp. FAM 26255 TaxID=3259519 RepID=UPI003883BE8C
MRNKKYLLRRKGFSVKKALLSIGVVASIGLAFSHSTEILESALANSATENVEKTQTNNVLSHPIVQKEQNAALNALINRWQEKSPEEIKEELLRQEEAGSIAYVVQWGDTLPNIASAAGLTVNELLDLNGLSSDYHINTSDVLIGLIDNQGIHVAGAYDDDRDDDDWDDDDWDDDDRDDDDWDDDDWVDDYWDDDDWDDDDWDDDDWDDDDWDDDDWDDDDWDDDDWDDDDNYWLERFYNDPNNIPGHTPKTEGDIPTTIAQEREVETTQSPDQTGNDQVAETTLDELPPVDTTVTDSNNVNLDAVTQEFHNLVNQERLNNGQSQLNYGDHLQTAAVNRTTEITEHFSHTRPNGLSFFTAPGFDQGGTIVGENLQQTYISRNATPEEIAQKLFDNWKKSPGHYENMMDGSYLDHAIQLDTYENGDNIIIYSTQVFSN